MRNTIEKLRKVREHDREVRRKHELQPRPKQMSFKAWLRRKNDLGESTTGTPIQDSLLAYIPMTASLDEKQETASNIAAEIVRLAEMGDTTIQATSVSPDN
jgi:hypothetical protein